MKRFTPFYVAILLLSVALFTSNCKKANIISATTDDVNLYAYLKQNEAQFSSIVKIIDKAGYNAFLNAYGTYTFFAPTNEAVKTYLAANNKGSLDLLTEAECKDLLKFHLLEEEVNSSAFTDGKLPAITMYGQYLTTSIENVDGSSLYKINRQALLETPNLKMGNGILQVINNVLQPSKLTVAQIVEANPELSVFTQALKETGWYNKLNALPTSVTAGWYTVIAETNKALADSGYNNYAALKARYSNTGNPTNASDSLYLYVAYHILPDIKYLADIVMTGSHETMAPLEVITNRVVNKEVLINDDEFNGVREKGSPVNRPASDLSATNGVVHIATSHFPMKLRSPFPVYWDVAMFPELMRLTNFYKKAEYYFEYGDGNAIQDIKWEKGRLRYQANKAGFNKDYLQLFFNASNGGSWYEFKTPLLVKGRYKVWICYRQEGACTNLVQASMNGVPLTSALIQFSVKNATVDLPKDAAQEALGWKSYQIPAAGSGAGRMVGIVDITTTGRQTLRLDLVSGTCATNNLDMVHFIPISMGQLWPRFGTTGDAQIIYQ
jgi:uncharacterized surface protein with fasciclin (FAS1) repeats